MKKYSSRTIIITLSCALLVIVCSLVFMYLAMRSSVVKMVDKQYEASVKQINMEFVDFFDEGVSMTSLLNRHVASRFDVKAYRKDDTHIEDVKGYLLPRVRQMVKGKNIKSLYVQFNPSLSRRPNDISLTANLSDGEFVRLEEKNSTYFDKRTVENEWYFKTVEAEEGVLIAPRYKRGVDSEVLVFSYNEPIVVDEMIVGVVGVEYSSENLESFVDIYKNTCDCHYWVADENRYIVYHPLGLSYQSFENYTGYLEDKEISQKTIQTYKGKMGETIKIIQLENGWYVGATFFNTELDVELAMLLKLILGMIMVGILVLVSCALIISRKISNPLKRLSDEIMLIESGSIDGNVSQELVDEKNEVGSLATTIYKMIDMKQKSFKEIGKQRDEIIHLYEETYAINADLENTLYQKEQLYDDLNVMFKRLEDANKELEDRVSVRTFELNDKNKHLRTLNKELEKSIKDLTLAQERLIESEKMVALGNMVSGIAHEINTPLGVSLTATSYIKDQFSELKGELLTLSDEELSELLDNMLESNEIIFESLKRSIELVGNFREIATNQHSNEKIAFDLLDYTNTVVSSLGHEYRHVVKEIRVNIPTNVEVYSYPGAYSQVITNLIMNSMRHGFDGRAEGEIFIDVIVRESYAVLQFKDNGVGISKTNLKKIFEPFFTTKRANGGTGLGLSVVYNLVKTTLMGDIVCKSRLGEGTEFNIEFPLNIDRAES